MSRACPSCERVLALSALWRDPVSCWDQIPVFQLVSFFFFPVVVDNSDFSGLDESYIINRHNYSENKYFIPLWARHSAREAEGSQEAAEGRGHRCGWRGWMAGSAIGEALGLGSAGAPGAIRSCCFPLHPWSGLESSDWAWRVCQVRREVRTNPWEE